MLRLAIIWAVCFFSLPFSINFAGSISSLFEVKQTKTLKNSRKTSLIFYNRR